MSILMLLLENSMILGTCIAFIGLMVMPMAYIFDKRYDEDFCRPEKVSAEQAKKIDDAIAAHRSYLAERAKVPLWKKILGH